MKNRTVWTSALLASTFGLLLTGCRSDVPAPGEAPIVQGNSAATDPAAANLIALNSAPQPVTRVKASNFVAPQQAYGETYPQAGANPQAGTNYGPGNSQQNEAYRYNTQQPASQGDPNAEYGDPNAQYSGDPIADAAEYDQYADLLDPNVPYATQAPPPLPADYEQPEAPGPDYLWTPGYWDYATAGYYYVPGTWVAAPYVGALWTPGWWGASGGRYRWHRGYWGRHVGYYGGINYGFGYVGFGYQGGYWNNDHFWYNRKVLRVNPRYVNNYVYQRNITVNNREYVNNTRVSYFGGNGGLRRGPAPQEFAALREQRLPPMRAQIENRRAAEGNRQQFYGANNGRPQMLFAARPLAADRNIQAPRSIPQQNFNNGGNRPGFDNRQALLPANANPQQRQQFEQQRMQFQQQANAQRDQNLQQRNMNLQQRGQNLQQRGVMEQQRNQMEQQRQQANVQRDQQLQQRNQQMQVQNQQRQQMEQQRQQQMQLQNQTRQVQDQQRNQIEAQRQQQMQLQNQTRQVQDQQRNQMEAQRQQQIQIQNQARQVQDQQRQQQQQVNLQHEQQVNQQRQQQEQQRNLMMQQRQVQDQQRSQQQQQMNAQREQMQAQRQQQQQQMQVQRQQQQAARPQLQMQQAPRMEMPHGNPGGNGNGHRH